MGRRSDMIALAELGERNGYGMESGDDQLERSERGERGG